MSGGSLAHLNQVGNDEETTISFERGKKRGSRPEDHFLAVEHPNRNSDRERGISKRCDEHHRKRVGINVTAQQVAHREDRAEDGNSVMPERRDKFIEQE